MSSNNPKVDLPDPALSLAVILRELDTDTLIEEVARRNRARRRGLCSYCGRDLDSTPRCVRPERHGKV